MQACGQGSTPPTLGGYAGTRDAGSDAPPSLLGDSGPIIPSCGTGPDGGVCACVDEPLNLDAPSLYFILDRSGSMNTGGKWTTVRNVIGKVVSSLGQRVRIGAAVFPDPSKDSCTAGRQVYPVLNEAPITADGTLGAPGPVDRGLIQTLGGITAYGGTPTAATLSGLLAHVKSFPGKTYVVLATDGGPNCDANATCGSSMCTNNIESNGTCTPTGPNCCDPTNSGTWLACLDAQPTLDAVTAFAQAGIPVYVIGIPGSEPYATLLDALAEAGGTARGSEPQYYAVSTYDQQALTTAMSQIAAKVTGSCTLELDKVPPLPNEVNVFLDGSAIPQSGPDGWTMNGTTVTILGASCQRILDGDVLDVRVVAGCPTITI